MANMQELLSQRFEAQRQKLVSMDIVAVAESLGMTLKPGSSGIYYWEEHDSFHIYPNTNTFRWWSRSIGTNTIDLVQVVQEEMTGHKPSFREVAAFLETGHFENVTVQPIVKEPFEYYLERYEHPDFNIGRQYLKEERGLSDETIDTFLASGNLATATRKKGDYFEPVIVFKSRDNDGKMIGASLQGIVENRVQHPERGRLKQMMKNSEGTAGFSLDVGTPKRLVFAEAPIDLMSYYEVNKDDLQDVKLVAMDGLKKSVVSRYVADLLTDGKYSQTMSAEQIRGALDALNQTTNLLQEHSDMITLAVDNDEAGQNFVKGLQDDGIPVIPDLPPRQTAQKKMDWNDYLKQIKKENAQMAETPEVEKQSLSELQESLSNEGDLVSTITSDSSIIYTNTVRFNQDYNLNLEVHSPEEVDNLSDVKAPWSLELTKDNQSLGFLAYGEDWGNEFDIEDELTNLENWIKDNQVENHLYSQEEVNSFLEPLTAENYFVEQKSLEPFSDAQKEHIREFFKTRVADVKTDYIYLPNGQEDLGYYLDGYLFAHHYAELDMLSPSKQVDALMERVSEHDQKFLEDHFGYQPDTPIEEYRQSEKNSDRIAEKEEQDFRNQFDRQSFAETIGLMQKYSPEEVLNESNSYHDEVRYQSLLIDLEKVDTDPMYRFIERYIDRDIDREALAKFSAQDFITIAKEKGLLHEDPSVEPWKAITITQPVNSYTVLSEEFDNVLDLYQFVNQKLEHSQRQELSALLSEPGRGTPLDTLMAIDSVAGDVEVNGQSILNLFPNGINEEATEIYRRSSAEIEAAASVEASPAEKEAVGELKSYGTFIINDDFLERRYGFVEHDNSIRTAIEQLSNLIGFNNMPINDQETEWVHTKEVDFEGTQLILDVYSSSEDKIFEGKNKNNNWSIAVLGENGPLGFLTYGEAWLDDINDGTTLRDKLTDLQTWITEGSIGKHLYTQQDYNQFNASLKEKALSQSQEPNTGGELFNRSSSSLGDDSPGTAPKPVEYETQPSFPTNVPLHFNIDRNIKSNYRLHQGYSYPKNRDIRNMNAYAEGIQKSANWYLNELANSTVTYFYVDGEEPKALQMEFKKRHWMHLTGLSPIYLDRLDSVSETFIDEIASGKTTFSNVSVGTGFLDKIQVLPMLPEILETDSFVFDDLSSIEKFGRLDASAAIRSDDKNMVLAFQVDDKNEMFPASLMKPGKKLNLEMDTLSQEKIILGVIVEKEGSTKVHRVNENYIKDGGEEMKSIVENKQFEEVKVTKTDVTAKKQKAKDSDGDGLTDDEEIALGTNPYSPDTDGDGILDSVEKASGTDATNPSDTPDSRKEEMNKRDLTLSEMIKAKNTAALNQHLQEGIKDYFDSDNYKNFLEGMSHFNNYSVRNIQLIKAQLPEASMVASFNEWKKRNGHVNKGEKALYVQAPVTVIKKDADGKPVINADTGEKETFTYFKPVPVFDISQVSPVAGKKLNLPKIGEVIPSQITKEYYQNVYRSLRDISQKENGIPIRFRELGKSYGSYSRKTNEITIKKGMTYEQTLSTLIHEMAHSELHNKKSLTERFEGKLTRSSKELQAESIAYVVSNHLGFDISNYSFAYLASWSKEPDGLENLKAQLEIVQEEASSLMKRIDKHLEKYQNLTVSKDEILTANQKRELSKATNPFYQSLQKAKAEVNNMKKGDEPSNEKTVKKDNRPTKC